MKSIIAGLLLFAGLQCVLSGPAGAQVGSACVGWYGNINFPGPNPPWIFNCQPEGPWLVVCQAMTSACPPAAAAAETCASCAAAAAGHPISLASGNTFIVETDVKVPGLSSGLKLVRTWNSMWPSTQNALRVGLFGPNWRSNYEERVFLGSDNYMKYARGDGSFWSFGANGSSLSVAAPAKERERDSESGHLLLDYDVSEWRAAVIRQHQRKSDLDHRSKRKYDSAFLRFGRSPRHGYGPSIATLVLFLRKRLKLSGRRGHIRCRTVAVIRL